MEQPEKELLENKSAKVEAGGDITEFDSKLIEERKKKAIAFFKKNYNWITYVVLAIIIWLAVRIRTRNLDGLRDITTGDWTLGPDLDPFLFLRWAKYIVANGSLFNIDLMRYVPLGFNTGNEYLLHPYMMAWFHKILGPLFGSTSVTHSAVLYPVFMFALTIIAFFLLARKIFVNKLGEKRANIIGLISSLFLTISPSLLPRTIAGIPEKESAAFLFLFLAFYFFLASWQAKGAKSRIVFAILAGASTTAMANIWGGYQFIFYTITPAIFLYFILGDMKKEEIYTYSVWAISSVIFMLSIGSKYGFSEIFRNLSSASAFGVLFIILIHQILFSTKLRDKVKKYKITNTLPKITSVVISLIILAIISTIIFGISFIPQQVNFVKDILIKPATSRLIQTVAENRQPYFTEWAGSFGPSLGGFPVIFWLFFIGSTYMFWHIVEFMHKNKRTTLTSLYVFLLTSIIFSRYSSTSLFNGENFASLSFYAIGVLLFVTVLGRYYYLDREEKRFSKLNFDFILLMMFFFLGVVSARAAVRTVMLLAPSVSIIISYFVVSLYNPKKMNKEESPKILFMATAIFVALLTIFAAYNNYQQVNLVAQAYVPSPYNQQWQNAMGWVRENTSENAVFAHWWDYGYWLQSIGERATVLDGGNAISYWNHLMGRHALTGTDNKDALEFLYAHNTTHFLIDSTDIGKYGAFSFIGSDKNLDRRSSIPTFFRNPQQTQERKNSTLHVYQGGFALDESITYQQNGTKIFLPDGLAGIGGILVERDPLGNLVGQPEGVFIYQGQQYILPLKYAYDDKFIEFDEGVEAGFFSFPLVEQANNQLNIDRKGVMLYLSGRTVKSQLARLYLYKEENPYFKLAHTEEDLVVSQIKAQSPNFESDIVYFQGLRGPIRIWEINYPENIELKEEFLNTEYPPELLFA